MIEALLRQADCRPICAAQFSRRLYQRIENDLQVESRTADDLEYVGGRGLLLKRLVLLVEQPRILNGDDGLSGKGLHQLDLPVGERADFLAGGGYDAR